MAGADLAWRWKDQDQLDLAARWGWMTPDEAGRIRAEGERVIEMIESRAAPFSERWPEWRPDPAWPVPALPADWARPA